MEEITAVWVCSLSSNSWRLSSLRRAWEGSLISVVLLVVLTLGWPALLAPEKELTLRGVRQKERVCGLEERRLLDMLYVIRWRLLSF